ncbi:MAG: transporter substrate-binding domain-containing protein [Betaproteobacteria bacterium]|nr:transporter substrate-binding domain-containing protein [Betaproteobacteria bacterium]
MRFERVIRGSFRSFPFPGRTVALLLAAWFSVHAVAAIAATTEKPEKPDVVLAVGGKATLYYLPLTLAERLGYFRDEGLNVEINDFAGGSKALQALVGGSADVTSGGYEHTIQMAAKGQRLEAFVLQGYASMAVGLVKGRFAHYAGPQDLRGRRVGVTAPGSSTHMMVNHLLASANLAPEDVSVIGVGTGASAINAVRSGQIDVLSSIEPVIVMLERSGDLRVVHETYTEAGARAVFGGALPSACLYAKRSFVESNPRTVQALTNAMVRALRWLRRSSVEEVMAVVPPQYMLGDRDAYRAALTRLKPVYSADGRIPPDGAQRSLRATATNDPSVRTATNLQVETTFTNRFVERAQPR